MKNFLDRFENEDLVFLVILFLLFGGPLLAAVGWFILAIISMVTGNPIPAFGG